VPDLLTAVKYASELSYEQIAEAEEYRRSFKLFAKAAWHIIEPGKKYVSGWHLDAIAEHLQAVIEGDIKRLLVNMPPRHGKSSYISTLIHPWSWLQNPSLRWLCASYALNLATRDNLKCRRIIKSRWFQARYGHLFELTKDQDAKMKFENNFSGYRQAVSVGAAGTTGEGGDILVIDDPHPIEQKRSDIKREAVLDWFLNTWMSRLNDEATGAMIVVGQRVHSQDVSGLIKEGAAGGKWVELNLPAEYEAGSPCRTYFPLSGKSWQDPRTEEGELLWEEKFPRPVIEQKKRIHGPLGFAAIYMQRPVPAGGNIFQSKNQRYFTIDQITECYLLETPRGIKPIRFEDCWKLCTVDLAISEKQSADFTVFAAYAVTPYKDLLLLEIIHEHFAFDEQLDQLVMFHEKHGFSLAAIESVAFQLAMVQMAKNNGLPAQEFNPPSDKVTRSTTASIWESNGKCYSLKNAHWLFVYEKEVFDFPKAPHDDQVDTRSMAAIVVCTRKIPGVLDLDSDDTVNKIDPTLSIEQIIDATAIQAEQALQALETQKEQEKEIFAKGGLLINPFEWAEAHEGGGGGWE